MFKNNEKGIEIVAKKPSNNFKQFSCCRVLKSTIQFYFIGFCSMYSSIIFAAIPASSAQGLFL